MLEHLRLEQWGVVSLCRGELSEDHPIVEFSILRFRKGQIIRWAGCGEEFGFKLTGAGRIILEKPAKAKGPKAPKAKLAKSSIETAGLGPVLAN